MGVHVTALLLIAGLWSLDISQTLGLSGEKLLRSTDSEISTPRQIVPESPAVRDEDQSPNYGGSGSRGIWKEKCDKNGGPTAYDTYNEIRPLKVYLLRLLGNFKQLPFETSEAGRKGQILPLFKNYCRRVPIVHKVEDYLTDSIRICLDPGDKAVQKTFQSLGRSLLDYICHDQGHRLARFAAAGGLECVVSKYQALAACYRENIDVYIEAFNVDRLDTNETRPVLGEEFRTNLENFRDCTVKLFNECGSRTATSVWNATVVYLRDKIPRENSVDLASMMTTREPSYNYTEATRPDVADEDARPGSSFRDTCEKNGGPTAFDVAVSSFQLVRNCSEYLTPDIAAVQHHGAGESRTDFGKLCHRAPILNELEKYSVESFKPCFQLDERRALDAFHNVFSSIREFICGGEGTGEDRFSTADVPRSRCLASKREGVINCTRQHFASYIRASGTPENLETLTFLGAEFCIDLEKFEDCSVNMLEDCEGQVTPDQWNSLFVFISNATICKTMQGAHTPTDAEIPSSTITPNADETRKKRLREEWWPNHIYV